MKIKKPTVKLWWQSKDTSVVSSVEQQTEQATALARISGQTLLVDPRTNPAVRDHADKLRNGQHRRILDANNDRVLRKIRVEDRRAEHAELGLEALREAKDTASPAHSVIALHKGRIRFMGASLAASITLSVGSAMGVEHLAHEWNAPKGSGYIAEVGLVGLATTAILYRSHLTRHGGKPTKFQDIILGALMVVPLLASMAANIAGAGPVGVACSAGAAAFGLFSHIVADASATALQVQAERVTGDEERDLRKIASGDDLFISSPANANANLNQPMRFQVPGSSFAPQKVQVRAEVQVPEVHEGEVREPADEPRTANPEPRTELPEPEPVNSEPQVREPAEPANPEPAKHEVREPVEKQDAAPRKQTPARTANLGDRAKRKASEVQQVVDLIHERGEKAVTLGVVREVLGFTKTTAYHRLVAARELVNQEAAVAS